jgi:hypothetical protein
VRFWGGGGRKSLGRFTNEVAAALAYDHAARLYHGNKAQLNFPDLPPQPDHASSQGPSPLSKPDPAPRHSNTLAACAPGGASCEGDLGPGQKPLQESTGEPEGPGALKRDPMAPEDPSSDELPISSQAPPERKRSLRIPRPLLKCLPTVDRQPGPRHKSSRRSRGQQVRARGHATATNPPSKPLGRDQAGGRGGSGGGPRKTDPEGGKKRVSRRLPSPARLLDTDTARLNVL